MSIPSSCKVLVIGGGIVGLTAAAFLARHGVDAVLVEKRASPSTRLRAKFFYPRTIELYRSLGIEEDIKAATPPASLTDAAIVHSLAGEEIRRWTLPAIGKSAESPCVASSIKQHDLECIVRVAAERLGARILFDHALTVLDQDEHGAVATIVAGDGAQTTLHADFVIGCDGANSMVRDRLGIGTKGLGDIVHSVSITARCDVRAALRGRPLSFVWVRQPNITGFISWNNDLTSVVLSLNHDPSDALSASRFTPEGCRALAAACLGLPLERVEVTDIHPWCLSSWFAESFRHGRVFLAGDAIHSTPPLGGFGANTGIHDVHNLALKLVSVIKHGALESLLDRYEEERGPVVRFAVAQATARLAPRPDARLPLDAFEPIIDEETISMGYRYPIMSQPGIIPNPIAVHPRFLHAEPGTRAPHIWLSRNGVRVSSLDLFGDGLVLLAGEDAQGWCEEAAALCHASGVPVSCYIVGRDVDDPDGAFLAAYNVSSRGVVLVRADGFVVWKAVQSDTFDEAVFRLVLLGAHELTTCAKMMSAIGQV